MLENYIVTTASEQGETRLSPAKRTQQDCLITLYRELEFNPVPVCGKFPPAETWERWQTERVDLDTLARWHQRKFYCRDGVRLYTPPCDTWINWGVITGKTPWSKLPGVVVVDSDDVDAERLVCERCPASPMAQTTPGGGRHRVYRHPGPATPNRQGTKIDGRNFKIDIRGDGGYILAPGSVHPVTLRPYEWDQPWTPDLLARCPVFDPTWLGGVAGAALIPQTPPAPPAVDDADDGEEVDDGEPVACVSGVPLDERAAQARRYLAKCPGTTKGQGADGACFNLAMKILHGFALTPEVAERLLCEWGGRDDQLDDCGGHYPWTERQIAHKVRDAYRATYRGVVGDRLRRNEAAWQSLLTQRAVEVVGSPTPPEPAEAPTAPTLDTVVDEINREVAAAITTRRRRALSLGEIDTLPPLSWRIKDHFFKDTLVCLFGPSGSCKSFLAFDWGMCVAYGVPYLGTHRAKEGKVLYVCTEGRHGIRNRKAAWMKARRITLNSPNMYVAPERFTLIEPTEAPELLKMARADIGAVPDLIVIDTLARNYGGDEDKAKDMNAFVNSVDQLRAETGATVLIVHHTGKDASGREPRGSSALFAACDTMIRADSDADGKITVQCPKQKDVEEFSDYVLLRRKIDLGEVEVDGEMVPQNSLVLHRQDDKVTTMEHLSDDERSLLKTLAANFAANPFGWVTAQNAAPDLAKSTFSRRFLRLQERGVVWKNSNGFVVPDWVLASI